MHGSVHALDLSACVGGAVHVCSNVIVQSCIAHPM